MNPINATRSGTSLVVRVLLCVAVGLVAGMALGIYFDAIAIGIAFGPLTGAVFALATWVRVQRIT